MLQIFLVMALMATARNEEILDSYELRAEEHLNDKILGIFKLKYRVSKDITKISELESIASDWIETKPTIDYVITYLKNTNSEHAVTNFAQSLHVPPKTILWDDYISGLASQFVHNMRNLYKPIEELVEQFFTHKSNVFKVWEQQLVQEQLDIMFDVDRTHLSPYNYPLDRVQDCYRHTYGQAKQLVDFRLTNELMYYDINSRATQKHFDKNISVSEQVNVVSSNQKNKQLLKDAKDYLLIPRQKCDEKSQGQCKKSQEGIYMSESPGKYPFHIPLYEGWLKITNSGNGLLLPFDIVGDYVSLMSNTLTDHNRLLNERLSKVKIEVNGTYEQVGTQLPLKLTVRLKKNEDLDDALSLYLEEANQIGRLVIAFISDGLKKHGITTQLKFDKNSYVIEGDNWNFNMSVVDKSEDTRLVLGIPKTGDKDFDEDLLQLYIKPSYYDVAGMCDVNKHQDKIGFGSESFDKKCREMMTSQLLANNDYKKPNTNYSQPADDEHAFSLYKRLKQEQMEADMASKNQSMFQGSIKARCIFAEIWGNTDTKTTQSYNPMVTFKSISCSKSNMFLCELGLDESYDMIDEPRSHGKISRSETTKSFGYAPHVLLLGAVGFIFIVVLGLFMVFRRKRRSKPYVVVKHLPKDNILQNL